MKISRECLTGLPAGTAELGLRSLPNRLVTRRTNRLLEESLRFEALLTFEPLFTTKAEGLGMRPAVHFTLPAGPEDQR